MGNKMLKSLHLRNVLSFRDTEVELGPLNILVGPNGSGKSNLLEIFDLLRHLPRDLQEFARISGGPRDWIWKGKPSESGKPEIARIETVMDNPNDDSPNSINVRHTIDISSGGSLFRVREERFENESQSQDENVPDYYFHVKDGFGQVTTYKGRNVLGWLDPFWESELSPDNTQPDQSIFRERRDPDSFPVITATGQFFEQFRLYRDWNMGRSTAVRQPQPADGRAVILEEDFSNLALVINRLQGGEARQSIDHHLAQFYENYERVHPMVEAGSVQLTLIEKGLKSAIPATRLSDGTIRFIALLAILCNPEPPPLICIEEPEIGLHPEVIPLVGGLLKTLAEKTQLFVTTHSTQLLDEFTDMPESVLIFERDFDHSTQMRRLEKEHLEAWIQEFGDSLGELWESGHIGGNRW
jgi:predicted ATPase